MARPILSRALLGVLIGLAFAAPVCAQSSLPELDRRVGALERDMRAVRRLVLPGGQVVEPEVDTGFAAAAPAAPAAGSGAPLDALTERVDALERQQRRLTAQVEEQEFKLRQLERGLAELRAAQSQLEAAVATPGDTAGVVAAPTPAAPPAPQAGVARDATRTAATARPPAGASGAAASAGPRPATLAASGATRPPSAAARGPAAPAAAAPATPDARFAAALALVEARDWPAVESAMTEFARANPRHAQASLARYWAGRAQHSQGRFEAAARTHFDNYQADQRGSHAQHSLYWVGQALVRIKRAAEACQVYTLAQRVYAEDMLAELRPQFATARRNAGCAA